MQKAEFEDTAVATLNHKVDAAAQAAPVLGVSLRRPPRPPPAPATTSAQPGVAEAGDLPPEAAADRKSRLAALKARLHQHMGRDADPPAEEPAPPPPPGPMIGLRQPQCLQNMGISLSGWVATGDHLQRRSSRQPLQWPGGHERSRQRIPDEPVLDDPGAAGQHRRQRLRLRRPHRRHLRHRLALEHQQRAGKPHQRLRRPNLWRDAAPGLCRGGL